MINEVFLWTTWYPKRQEWEHWVACRKYVKNALTESSLRWSCTNNAKTPKMLLGSLVHPCMTPIANKFQWCYVFKKIRTRILKKKLAFQMLSTTLVDKRKSKKYTNILIKANNMNGHSCCGILLITSYYPNFFFSKRSSQLTLTSTNPFTVRSMTSQPR